MSERGEKGGREKIKRERRGKGEEGSKGVEGMG